MCGIAGFLDNSSKTGINELVSMTGCLHHRGPDDTGHEMLAEGKYSIGFGHKRLSIIDLSATGHQPMKFDNLTITYNGEVYNFREIMKELEALGYSFVSRSDTEVVLKAFHRWGYDCIKKFRGMWAFAIWDSAKEKLILCRDRMGVKPLYWYERDGLILFSSELKSFHFHPRFRKELNQEALSLYLQYGYITSPHSIFRNTCKVEPGHFIEISLGGGARKIRYWNVEDHFFGGTLKHNTAADEELITSELESILSECFQLRMVSDVPVGVFLSGGIDSSLLTALLQNDMTEPLQTFTIGFREKEYDEAPWASKVAAHLGTNHTELYCTAGDAFDIIQSLPDLYDEPFGDASAIPTHLVSKLARRQVKVALSADGGDEQFCGYGRHWKTFLADSRIPAWSRPVLGMLTNEMFVSLVSRMGNVLLDGSSPVFKDKLHKLRDFVRETTYLGRYDKVYNFFSRDGMRDLGVPSFASNTASISAAVASLPKLTQSMVYDLKTYLTDDILVKVDRASMGVSLESREPFLDHKLLEYSSRIPESLKYRNGEGKYILRKLLYKYVPRALVDRPKQGFSIPVYEWFRSELKDLYISYLNKERIEKEGIFNSREVDRLLQEYLSGKAVYPLKLWFLFVFQVWREKYL